MKRYKKPGFLISIVLLCTMMELFTACTKYGNGFLSPYVQYSVNQFTIIRGRTMSSYSLVTDGSTIPLHVKWTHIYDSTGNIVDAIFTKAYTVQSWISSYNSATDTSYGSIIAKLGTQTVVPISVNESSGTIEANKATEFLPLGTYTMDLELSNSAGSEPLKKIVEIIIQDGAPLEMSPEQGSFSNSLLIAGTASGNGTLFNGPNNPFDSVIITRFADTPNILILKVTDKNGVPFNPKTGEFTKRPNSGVNPTPPFLQNLQDYARDAFVATDTAISLKYPVYPYPILSLGNGLNMYYRIPSKYVHIDKTSGWSVNVAGNYYQGTSDLHYLGSYPDNVNDYAIRIPMRIQKYGAYKIDIKILNATHR